MSDFVQIAAPAAEEIEPFRFELAGKKFELPALTEDTAPLELMPLLLLASSEEVGDEELVRAGVMFLEYIKSDEPKLWKHLKAQRASLAWLNGLMQAWLEHAGIDPKASSSSS